MRTNFLKKFIFPLLLSFCLLSSSTFTILAATYYPHTNHQGSVVAVTDESGDVVSMNSYYPYGDDLSKEGPQDLQERGYTGQKKDSEVDIYYYNARYYDPNLSIFLSADFVGDQWNRYRYVANNPVNVVDPSGQWDEEKLDDSAIMTTLFPEDDISVQEEIIMLRAAGKESLFREYLARKVLGRYPNLEYQSQQYAGSNTCGPTTWAMQSSMLINETLEAKEVAIDWIQKGYLNPSRGSTIQGASKYTERYTDFNPLLYVAGDEGLREVDKMAQEYNQPAMVAGRVNYNMNRYPHIMLFLGADSGYAMFYDPYLYNTQLDDNEIFVSNGVLFVDIERAQATFRDQGSYYLFLDIPTIDIPVVEDNKLDNSLVINPF